MNSAPVGSFDYLFWDLELVSHDLCVHVTTSRSESLSDKHEAAPRQFNAYLTIASDVGIGGINGGLSMPEQIDRDNYAFGPRALNCLALAFDRAWRQLRSEGIDTDTPEEIERIRTKLAQSIIACATAREYDVEQLKEVGLMGFRWVREFSDDPKLRAAFPI